MKRYTFAKHTSFKEVLDSRVRSYLDSRNITGRDSPFMYFKIVLFLVWTIASYFMLLTLPGGLVSAAVLSLSLALALVGVGFNIQHDGNHEAISRHWWVNRLAGLTLDVFAASSFMWKKKHNVMHHTFTNIEGLDDDISVSPLGRLNRHQRRYWFHRYQQWYLWIFYAFVHIKYLFGDILTLVIRKSGEKKRCVPRGMEMVGFVCGKIAYFGFAFALPLWFYSWWKVVVFYCAISMTMGLVFSTVFQLAHMVDILDEDTFEAPSEFAVHQIATTADFATNSWWLTFFLGGLNFQREHHLFPKISHVYYPAIAEVIREVCREYGVKYHEQSLWSALKSHYRFLHFVGRTA